MGISNYRDSYRKQYLFNNANPGCNTHVTIHVYIHIKCIGSQKLSVAGSGCSSIWISIPETRLEYSFPVALTDGGHFVNIVDAINFFNNTYGLDFSASPPNENYQRSIKDAVMSPYILFDHIEYFVTMNNWIRTGNTRSNCYRIREGGFEVTFLADRTLYGSYGGAEGKPISVGNSVIYGFTRIDVCEQSPVLIQHQSATPFRPEPVDGISIINLDLYNRVLGNGKAQGIFVARPDPYQPEKFCIMARNTLTFSA